MQAAATSDGEAPGFRAFYREHHAFVCRAIDRFGVAPAEQGDAVQDTFVTAFRKLHGHAEGSTRAWLYGIARRIASNYRRGARRAARKHEAARDGLASFAPQTLDALHTLDRFLAELDPLDRELFVRSEILGMSGPEIADAIGMRQGMVYARLRLLRVRVIESAPDGLFAALCRVRADEPRTTTRGWLAIVAAVKPAWVAKLALAIVPLAIGSAVIVADLPRAAPAAIAVPVAPAPAPVAVLAAAVPPPPPISAPQPSALPIVAAPHAPRIERATPIVRDDGNALLAAAITALDRGEPTRAIALTDEHARRFAGGALDDTRWALRIEALCRAGKLAQAKGEASAFLAAHPRSGSAAAIGRGCETITDDRKPAASADTARSR